MFDENENTTGLSGLSARFDTASKPIILVDVEKYQAFLDGWDMTPAEKDEFLQRMWGIIVTFVELGFGVQSQQEVCGKEAEGGSKTATEAFDAVCSVEPDKNKEKPNGFSP
ncbi:hypothetical protein [Jannaschia aquimarina]|uniref:Uncharacterized protein n=1 Tax=Jannaschia aquimarina TaxID=935700 RepID=A0A0D1D900_9RHOB|nr:hypothetical protein [Jannaschia aquimarina]KIT16378.1 hypothetical protein jaqu_18620 [Jannaschia aquimarina]SNT05158.1 hypothetical protein SAMN05421775_10534 [Jannaschia aquimarina]